ncbi:unnamed protein product [Calypogeia fissa]
MGSNSFQAVDDTRRALLVRHGNAVLGAIATETVFFYPLDTLKTLLQVSANAGKSMGISAIVEGVGATSGFAGLYGGAGWQVLGRLPVLSARFGVYEIITAYFSDGRSENFVTVSEALLAGLAAGACESVISTPFDFLKVRAQVITATTGEVKARSAFFQSQQKTFDPNSALRGSNAAHWKNIRKSLSLLPVQSPNLIPALKEYPWLATGSGQPPLVKDVGGLRGAIRLEGWKSLWSGLRPGLFRDAIYGGCFFSVWQYLDDLVAEWKAYKMDPPPSSWDEVGPSSPLQLSLTAGIAASFAAAASHSFDSAKSRAQATVVPKYLAMERTLLKWKVPGNWFEYIVGFSPLDRPFLRKALGVRALQHGLGTFALVLTYHTTVQTALSQRKFK